MSIGNKLWFGIVIGSMAAATYALYDEKAKKQIENAIETASNKIQATAEKTSTTG